MNAPTGITKVITVALMFSCAAALIIWDVVVATNRVAGDTISETSLSAMQKYPIAGIGVGLALGIILGHLFWPQYPKLPESKPPTP